MLQKKSILLVLLFFFSIIAYSQEENNTPPNISEKIKFHVQIGDSPRPVERGQFAKIIEQPTQSISVLKNNGWYKYLIGEYDNYWEASKLCISLIENKKLKNAIVVASKNDKYIELENLPPSTFSPPKIMASGYLPRKGIAYSVQILTTNSSSLSTHKIMRTFNLTEAVYIEETDGEFCFMVGSVYQIREATILLKKIKACGLSNAFLVAYLDGNRVPLRTVL
jgi:hypothetical protein